MGFPVQGVLNAYPCSICVNDELGVVRSVHVNVGMVSGVKYLLGMNSNDVRQEEDCSQLRPYQHRDRNVMSLSSVQKTSLTFMLSRKRTTRLIRYVWSTGGRRDLLFLRTPPFAE